MDERQADDDELVSEGAVSAVTGGVKITALPSPIMEESDPLKGVFAFAYQISIENIGDEAVQLLDRHWHIYAGDVEVGEIVGPGVVGLQPIIEPGKSFEYTSGAVIHEPFGQMYGSYTFKLSSGTVFEAEIPHFPLSFPIVVH